MLTLRSLPIIALALFLVVASAEPAQAGCGAGGRSGLFSRLRARVALRSVAATSACGGTQAAAQSCR